MDGKVPVRYTSLESLAQGGNVLVKKRHSTYSLSSSGHHSSSQSPPPLPSMPSEQDLPSRPPRNPARSNIPPLSPFALSSSASSASLSSHQPFVARKPKSSTPYFKRPSTADSVFAPSFTSRTSAFSTTSNFSASSAGSRDKDKEKERKQVTPWEFQELMEDSEREVPVPAHLVDVTLGGVATNATPSLSPDAANESKKLTGRVEEVTPWEMHAPPSPALSDFSSSSHPSPNGRARSSTNTSVSTTSTGNSLGKSTSTSGSSNKSVGSGLVTPTPYAMRFSSVQTGLPHQEMREVRDHNIPFTLSPAASASTSTLGSVGSVIHRQHDQPHFPISSASSYSGDIIYADAHSDIHPVNSVISLSTPLPMPPSPLRSAPSISSLTSSLLPTPAVTTSPTTKRVPTPLPLKSAASTASVAPSIASAGSALSASSKERTPPIPHGITGTVEDVTPWELYPAPAVTSVSPPSVASPPPLPPMPTTPSGKEKKRRSSMSMSLEERRKSGSGGVAGAFSSMSMGLGLGKVKTREKEKERERNGSLVGHTNPPPLPPASVIQSQVQAHAMPLQQASQSHLRPEKEREARVATGLKEDVTPWELEDVVPVPRGEGLDTDTAQYVDVAEKKKSASGTPTPVTATGMGMGVAGEAGPSTARARGSMTLEQMAEVMPWELYPIPVEVGKTGPMIF